MKHLRPNVNIITILLSIVIHANELFNYAGFISHIIFNSNTYNTSSGCVCLVAALPGHVNNVLYRTGSYLFFIKFRFVRTID